MSKYEKCVQDVKRKQDMWCADNKYKRGVNPKSGKKCYNPWAICTASVGRYSFVGTNIIYKGPRGGLYTITNGRKRYIN